jgi:predicted nucleic acid-binding protein
MIYLDSSALLKLLVEERESAALSDWISERSATPRVSSELAKLEVVRAARRLDSRVVSPARALVAQLDLIPLTGSLIEKAADAGDLALRSLDAIHLASALSIRDTLTAFVAYDHRLIAAAGTAGLAAESPH